MYYFLYLKVSGLYLSKLNAMRSKSDRLLVAHDKKLVLECEKGAELRGVHAGVLLSEAKSILREDGQYVEVRADDFVEERNRWLDICLMYSHVIESESPASAWLDLSGHADPSYIADQLVRNLFRETGYLIWAGCSNTKWIAKVLAREIQQMPLDGLPIVEWSDKAFDAIQHLPTQFLLPVEQEIRERLVQLGYRRIGHVAQAPISALSRQFGKKGVLVNRAALGLNIEPVQPNYPDQSFTHHQKFDTPVDCMMSLEKAIDCCATRCAQELCSQDRVAQSVLLTVETETGFHSWMRKFTKATQKATTLKTILRQGLGSVNLEEGVVSIRVHLFGLVLSERSQLKLGNENASHQNQAVARSSVQRLKSAYGNSVLLKASDIELPRRKKLLLLWRQSTGWAP